MSKPCATTTRRSICASTASTCPACISAIPSTAKQRRSGRPPSAPITGFLLPVHGKLEARVRKDLVDCDTGRGVLSDPSRTGQLVRSETGCGRLNVILTESAVRRQLGALLGMPLSRSPDFEPAIDVAQGYGRNFAGYLHLAIDDFERDSAMLSSPITMQQFEQMVFTNLLLSHPHSYSQSLRRLAKLVASGDVKRAIDYMGANLTSPIGLPDITASAGVPGRTLLEHFKRYKGMSPIAYLRRARFAKVREALRSAEPEETSPASRWAWASAIWAGFPSNTAGAMARAHRKRCGNAAIFRPAPAVHRGPAGSGASRGVISHRRRRLLRP